MSKTLKKTIPFLVSLCLLLGMLPFGGLMVSAEMATFESKLHMVGYPIDGVIGSVFNNNKILCLHDQNWDSAGLTDAIPDGAKLVVKYDTTQVEGTGGLNFFIDTFPAGETQGEIWAKERIDYLPSASTQMVTLVNENGAWSKVKGTSKGAGCYGTERHMGLPLGTSGYVIIEPPKGYELKDLSGWWFFRWDIVHEDILEDSFKFRIGWVAGNVEIPSCTGTKPNTPSPSPSTGDIIRGTIPSPDVFGDNYVVTGSKTQIIQIGADMTSNPIVNLRSLASAPAEAEAFVFRFSIPNIELFVPEGGGVAYNEHDRWTHVSYWNYMAFGENFTGNAAAAGGRYTNYTMCYFKDDVVNVDEGGFLGWAGQLPLNCEGYVVVKVADLQSFSQAKFGRGVTVSDIEELTFNQEWWWYAGLFNKQIYISDIGYVMNVDDFKADFVDSYAPAQEKELLNPTGNITLKADRVEGTFAELSWGEFKGANRYRITVYTKDGFYREEKTRQTAYALEGLSTNTNYQVQIVPLDEERKSLGASNILAFKTADKNSDPYRNGLLAHDTSMIASVKKDVVSWKWLDGADYYAIHLYEKNGDKATFLDRFTTNSKKGSYRLTTLKEEKEYVVQLVSYTADNAIMTVYTPASVRIMADVGGSTTNNDNNKTTTGATKVDGTGVPIPTGSHTDVTVPTSGNHDSDTSTTEGNTDVMAPSESDNLDITTATVGNTDATTQVGGENTGGGTPFPIGVIIAIGVAVVVAAGAVVIVLRKRQEQQ